MSDAPLDPRVRAGLAAQLSALRSRLESGERRVGWKVALNDPRVQQALGIPAPVIGYLASGSGVRAGGSHSLAGATRPAVEPEIAVHVGEGGQVAGLGPALELIDVDLPFDDLERIMSANVFHRAVVLGPLMQGAASVHGLEARLLRDGVEEHAIDVARAAMEPGAVVELVGGYLEAMGERLEPGDVIIAGSLVAAVPARAGERFELQVDGLGAVALELA